MVLLLDGYSKIGTHLWNDLGCLISLRHLFRLRAVKNLFYFLRCVRNKFWVTI